ncbi:hypothetical protein [Mucilaginibacter ginkgonis]|uniref:Uncharacterized protein n=1 Tax=Mucilaginibacter ginkgonis TaxID=2682091 RepID=A0A6I4HVU9_9SPHI|nr:hypothetical protein [Mucilaginibacter ginkgonis]QQL49912.1 hypothetical protein GO620_000225 [Mucilaginibacter ginkgonis]
MENEIPSFSFNIPFQGRDTDCEVKMHDGSYDVFFNGDFVATVATNDSDIWVQISGEKLPADITETIGDKIESRYL